jgi:hypothetical protein
MQMYHENPNPKLSFPGAHVYGPSYSWGNDKEDLSSKPAPGK